MTPPTMSQFASKLGERRFGKLMLRFVKAENEANGRVTGGKPRNAPKPHPPRAEISHEIVRLHKTGMAQADIARHLGIDRAKVNNAVVRERRAPA